MRYRIRVTRTQVAEGSIPAPNQDTAIQKVQAELDSPHGYVGNWTTINTGIDVIAIEPDEPPTLPSDGPLLLGTNDAPTHLGVPATVIRELINDGQLEHVRVNKRFFIAREALANFILANTHVGFEDGDPRPTRHRGS